METYHGVRVVEIREKSAEGVPFGPTYKGLPREAVEKDSTLSWMLESREDVTTAGSEEGEIVWVLAEKWDEWRDGSA